MKLTEKEIYTYLIVYQRYALTRWNHLQPSSFFDECIEVLKRWRKEKKSTKKIEINWVLTTAEQLLEEFNYEMRLREYDTKTNCSDIKNEVEEYVRNLKEIIAYEKNKNDIW